MLTAAGKVRHRTFGKLPLLFPVFPRTALQLYSTPYQAYFLQLYSTAVPRYARTAVLREQMHVHTSAPVLSKCTHS